MCPHYEAPVECGPDCANTEIPDEVQNILKTWKPEPCGGQSGQSCNFSKNMRAAQCMLGPESLYSIGSPSKNKGHVTTVPYGSNVNELVRKSFFCL